MRSRRPETPLQILTHDERPEALLVLWVSGQEGEHVIDIGGSDGHPVYCSAHVRGAVDGRMRMRDTVSSGPNTRPNLRRRDRTRQSLMFSDWPLTPPRR